MVEFEADIHKFDKKGEKTGWTYIEIPAHLADKIKPNTKKSFYVKGKLDSMSISSVSLLPMGDGDFIIPINGDMRKKLKKGQGDTLAVQLEEDKKGYTLNKDLMLCLEMEPEALYFFNSLPSGHRNYFSKWIDSAKTEATQTKRITMTLEALLLKMGYAEMIRANKGK